MTEQIKMPSSGGGLIRYFDDYKSKIRFKPHYVVVAIILVLILQAFLHASNWLK